MSTEKNEKSKYIGMDQTNPAVFRLFNKLHKVFAGTQDGRELLEMLKERYFGTACSDPTKPDSHVHFRDGENNIIRTFMYAINEINTHNKHSEG